MATGLVAGKDGVRQVERLLDHARIQAVGKGQGGGGQRYARDGAAVRVSEEIARRLDGHGYGVLVPVRRGALALGRALQAWSEPGIGAEHCAAL